MSLFRKKKFLVEIDQGIHKGKMKNEKNCGFSFSINIANFESFPQRIKLTKNLLFLKSDVLCTLYNIHVGYIICFLKNLGGKKWSFTLPFPFSSYYHGQEQKTLMYFRTCSTYVCNTPKYYSSSTHSSLCVPIFLLRSEMTLTIKVCGNILVEQLSEVYFCHNSRDSK